MATNVPLPAGTPPRPPHPTPHEEPTANAPAPAAPVRRRVRGFAVVILLGLVPLGYWGWHQYRIGREWRRAEAALARYDLAAAAAHLDRYTADRPDDPRGWFLAARTARRRERFGDAARYLERCQELGGVTEATKLEWDLARIQQGEVAGTDTRLRTTIGPDHPDALLVLEALARGYTRVERLADAIEACNLWLARQPDHPWPHLWRGMVYERLGHLDRAAEDYRRAVEAAPAGRDARLALGGLLLRQRQPAAAAEQYEAALAPAPDDPEALTGLAGCRVEEGRPADALPLLDRAGDPNSPQVLFLRGKIALLQDDPAGAERWLREAVRVSPYNAEAVHQLTLALRALGRDEEATRTGRRADELRAGHTRLDELIRLIARTPADPKLRHEAGVLALRVGREAEGVRWLQGVLALPGDHRDTHAALADYYRRAGDPERADYHGRRARSLR